MDDALEAFAGLWDEYSLECGRAEPSQKRLDDLDRRMTEVLRTRLEAAAARPRPVQRAAGG